jgi:hypothetical protein
MAKTRAARKKRGYKVWTSADLRTLRDHSRAKTPVRRIAKELRRSEPTIRMKAYQLGFSVGHRRPSAKKKRI